MARSERKPPLQRWENIKTDRELAYLLLGENLPVLFVVSVGLSIFGLNVVFYGSLWA